MIKNGFILKAVPFAPNRNQEHIHLAQGRLAQRVRSLRQEWSGWAVKKQGERLVFFRLGMNTNLREGQAARGVNYLKDCVELFLKNVYSQLGLHKFSLIYLSFAID
jgi:hypothetical protein